MFMRVRLLNGFRETLIYKVPETWNTQSLVGSLVEVPLQKRTEAAIVEDLFADLDTSISYTIREGLSQTIIPSDPHYLSFIKKLSDYYALDQFHFLKRLRSFLQEKEEEIILQKEPSVELKETVLTAEQQSVVNALIEALEQGSYYPALLHGVTGSGKTEIYKKLITHCWNRGKSSLLLLPEVSLAVQFFHLLKKQLPADFALYGFHSATSVKEKRALWNLLLSDKPAIIIGVHLPVLLPIPHLGVIIVDEEHEVGFQEKKHPKVNTKEAALLRAQESSIPFIAGSATPSIASIYNVHHRNWNFFELKNRFAGSFPKIEVVKLTSRKARKHFFISKELEGAITDRLAKKEQTIIFLNRRGYSFFIQCKGCGMIPQCTQCSVSLTLHEHERLICHYCNLCIPAPSQCTGCKGTTFLKKGIGTQQVVSVLEKLFPDARIARADLDVTINKKKWRQTIESFEVGSIDILVGTQTITKGYHFPRVTLVGILWADINLSLPLYNAAEVSLQQLIQVSGRAGRQSSDSLVIVQTMISHPIFNYITEQDYNSFYAYEIEKRQLVEYPPLVRFAEIELKHAQESIVHEEARKVARFLKEESEKNKRKIIILGPALPPVQKIKNVCSRKIYLKAHTVRDMILAYKSIDKSGLQSSCFFTPNPLS